jgi:tetratricopeptide (TPR) repeat protein
MRKSGKILWLFLILVLGVASAHAEDKTMFRAREGASALLRGQYDKAITAYDEVLATPEIADFVKAAAYSDRGVAKWRLKRTAEAVEDFNLSIQISPENATVYNNRGNAVMDLGHPDEAARDFDRAIALSPNYGAAYNNRGNARTALGQYEQAFRFPQGHRVDADQRGAVQRPRQGSRRAQSLPCRDPRFHPRAQPQ